MTGGKAKQKQLVAVSLGSMLRLFGSPGQEYLVQVVGREKRPGRFRVPGRLPGEELRGAGTAIMWRAFVLIARYVKYKQRGST